MFLDLEGCFCCTPKAPFGFLFVWFYQNYFFGKDQVFCSDPVTTSMIVPTGIIKTFFEQKIYAFVYSIFSIFLSFFVVFKASIIGFICYFCCIFAKYCITLMLYVVS